MGLSLTARPRTTSECRQSRPYLFNKPHVFTHLRDHMQREGEILLGMRKHHTKTNTRRAWRDCWRANSNSIETMFTQGLGHMQNARLISNQQWDDVRLRGQIREPQFLQAATEKGGFSLETRRNLRIFLQDIQRD